MNPVKAQIHVPPERLDLCIIWRVLSELHLFNYVSLCSDSCPTCGPISAPVNGFVRGSTHECGDAMEYGCNAGYELAGDDTVYCDNGQWNAPTPSCVTRGKYFFVTIQA